MSGYCGLLLGSPVILYEIIAFVLPGLTRDERKFLGPIVLGSSVLFYAGISFSYFVLVPAALNFFVTYAEGVVESLWSIDQYFEFVLVLLFSTGLSFQVMTMLSNLFQVLKDDIFRILITTRNVHFNPERSFNIEYWSVLCELDLSVGTMQITYIYLFSRSQSYKFSLGKLV